MLLQDASNRAMAIQMLCSRLPSSRACSVLSAAKPLSSANNVQHHSCNITDLLNRKQYNTQVRWKMANLFLSNKYKLLINNLNYRTYCSVVKALPPNSCVQSLSNHILCSDLRETSENYSPISLQNRTFCSKSLTSYNIHTLKPLQSCKYQCKSQGLPYIEISKVYNSYTDTASLIHCYAKQLHTSSCYLESNTPSSQVEITVNALKEKAEAKKGKLSSAAAGSPTAPPSVPIQDSTEKSEHLTDKKIGPPSEEKATSSATDSPAVPESNAVSPVPQQETKLVVKKSIWTRVKEEILHYYHGFRLLFIDTKICTKYCYRVLKGEKLSRREHRQLVRTTGDLFRLLPFSVFIIIPFMELLLPVALKLFPGMLPSTFETANEKEAKIKKRLKVKLEMAKFLQETLDSMALQAKGHRSESAKEFVLFFEKVRQTGEHVSNEEILKFSKLFADSITLDSLARPQLMAICRLLEMQPFGTNNFLRFQIRMKLRSLIADDKLIKVEGVDSLSSWELQQACRSRGMRAYGMTDAKLRQQLNQWLELSLDQKVPQSLLLLSRTLYLPEAIDQNATLAATISQLPEEVKTRTKAAIGKREGKIDNKTRLEVIKNEEKKIMEDKRDMEEELRKIQETKKKGELGIGEADVVSVTTASDVTPSTTVNRAVTHSAKIERDDDLLIDRAPIIEDKAPLLTDERPKKTDKKHEELQLSSEDLHEVEEALETIGAKQRRMIIEEQELSELKTEMKDYLDDIEDFKQVISEVPERADLKESKAARRLFSKINKLIAQTEPIIDAINAKTEEMQKVVDAGDADKQHKATLVNLEDFVNHLRQVTDAPNSAKLSVIGDVLTSMDTDNDGAIKLEHILKALELLSEDQVGVPSKLFEEVMQSIAKEEQLETKTVVQRAITVSRQHHQLADKQPL